ncbi:MAG TPA: sigma-70 family RNA polymerase sigma factor [Chthoniobacteraceae bacterium]|nr:sigma-70 family RNA polymerase sigma factor [Chthoniobacteraceae bacterium]
MYIQSGTTPTMVQDDYERFVAPIQGRMVDCVWRIVRDPHEAQDVVQEALLHVTQRFHEVRKHPNPTALLLRICANKALDHVRRHKTRRDALEQMPAKQHDGATPSRALAWNDDMAQVLDFIRTIPEREAEAITLHALEEMDYPEVAAAMGCAESTVRVWVGRARERFRDAFRKQQPFFSPDNQTTPKP